MLCKQLDFLAHFQISAPITGKQSCDITIWTEPPFIIGSFYCITVSDIQPTATLHQLQRAVSAMLDLQLTINTISSPTLPNSWKGEESKVEWPKTGIPAIYFLNCDENAKKGLRHLCWESTINISTNASVKRSQLKTKKIRQHIYHCHVILNVSGWLPCPWMYHI